MSRTSLQACLAATDLESSGARILGEDAVSTTVNAATTTQPVEDIMTLNSNLCPATSYSSWRTVLSFHISSGTTFNCVPATQFFFLGDVHLSFVRYCKWSATQSRMSI